MTTTKPRRGPGRPTLSPKIKAARCREAAGLARSACDRLGLDAIGLAAKLGTDADTVRAWLAGRRGISKVARKALEDCK